MAGSFGPRAHQLMGVSASIRRIHPQQLNRATTCLTKRFASTESAPLVGRTKRKKSSFSRFLFRSSLVLVAFGGYFYFTDTRASAHRYIAVPLIRWLYPDAEDAHHIGVLALKELYKWNLHPRERSSPDLDGKLATEVILKPPSTTLMNIHDSH